MLDSVLDSTVLHYTIQCCTIHYVTLLNSYSIQYSVYCRILSRTTCEVPPAAREWQLPMDLPADAMKLVEELPEPITYCHHVCKYLHVYVNSIYI